MKIIIRVLEITTVIITILLIAVVGLAAYSVKDLQVGFGYSSLTLGSKNELTLSFPFYVNNVGLTDLKNFNLTTTVYDFKDEALSQESTFAKIIPKGENATIQHNVTVSMYTLTLKAAQYLFRDENLTIKVDTGMTLAEILPCTVSTNLTFPWGAPMHNLTISRAKIESFNATHVGVEVPLSFDNHAAFPLKGELTAEFYGNAATLVGNSSIPLDIAAGSSFSGFLTFFVPTSTESVSSLGGGRVDLYFSGDLFKFGPVVMTIG